MNRNERVLSVVRDAGLSDSEFARRIGASKHQFSNWKNKNQQVPDKYVIAIIEQFPDLDARWLLTGNDGDAVEKQQRETFEQYKERFEKLFTDIIDMKDQALKDKERIIKLKDDIVNDQRQILEMMEKTKK